MKATRKRGLIPSTRPLQGLTADLKATYDAWPERFRSKVELSASCWVWTGCKDRGGYGTAWNPEIKKSLKAHRYSLELVGRKPTFGVAVDHLCRNPSCVRPDHLEEVGTRENVRRGRMSNDGSGWCRAGIHPWTPENIYRDTNGRNRCHPCRLVVNRERLNPEGNPATGARNHCPQGHPYDTENTRHSKDGRACRACDRAKKRERGVCPECNREMYKHNIKSHIHNAHEKTRKPREKPEWWADAASRALAGSSTRELAESMGLNISTVYRALRSHGLVIRGGMWRNNEESRMTTDAMHATHNLSRGDA